MPSVPVLKPREVTAILTAFVEFEGEPVRVSADGWFLAGFRGDAPPKEELVVVFPDGRRERRILAGGMA